MHIRLAVQAFVLGEIRFPVPGARLSTQGLFELEQLRFIRFRASCLVEGLC